MKKTENDIIEFWIEDGIMYSKFKKQVAGGLEDIKKIIEARHEISEMQKQYWCYDFTGIKAYSKEARDYAEIHGQEYLHATAAIINSFVTSFILNIFMKLKSPKVPLKAFTNKEDAVAWLRELRAQNLYGT